MIELKALLNRLFSLGETQCQNGLIQLFSCLYLHGGAVAISAPTPMSRK